MAAGPVRFETRSSSDLLLRAQEFHSLNPWHTKSIPGLPSSYLAAFYTSPARGGCTRSLPKASLLLQGEEPFGLRGFDLVKNHGWGRRLTPAWEMGAYWGSESLCEPLSPVSQFPDASSLFKHPAHVVLARKGMLCRLTPGGFPCLSLGMSLLGFFKCLY